MGLVNGDNQSPPAWKQFLGGLFRVSFALLGVFDHYWRVFAPFHNTQQQSDNVALPAPPAFLQYYSIWLDHLSGEVCHLLLGTDPAIRSGVDIDKGLFSCMVFVDKIFVNVLNQVKELKKWKKS